MMPCQGKLLSYLTFLSVKEVLERGDKSKRILSRRQHWDNSVPDTLVSRSGFDKDPHPTEQLVILLLHSEVAHCKKVTSLFRFMPMRQSTYIKASVLKKCWPGD